MPYEYRYVLDCVAGFPRADFSTHTYQQDFRVAPNPKKIIQLDASGKQGRYVRIQLLDKDYLSLAEVQVMGIQIGMPLPPLKLIEPSALRAAKAYLFE
jgi:hypothetical protein